MDKNKFNNIWNTSIDKAINQTDESLSKFKIHPVPPKEFFELWLHQPLFPEQYRIIDQVFTSDYQDWKTDIKEILLLWGEGGSKDYTVVRTLIYCCYWLCCLRDPQSYFKIGASTPIVVACMSVNEDHAKDVFFKQFTTVLKKVINPSTGSNFFKDIGVDLRDGKDIQTRKVIFPNYIEAYALDACLPGGEKVLTNKGWVEIGKIVNKKLPVKVLTYNFKNNKLEWKPIKYYFKKEDPNAKWVKVFTNFSSSKNHGKSFVCTDIHKVLMSDGSYKRAKDLLSGNSLLLSKRDFTKDQLQLILGGLIGDSHLRKDNIIEISHGISQLNYLKFKHKILEPFVSPIKEYTGGYKKKYKKFIVHSNESTKQINKSYKKVLPQLSDLGLAIWYCDDGHLTKHNSIEFSLYYPLSKNEEKFIINYFNNQKLYPKIRRYKAFSKNLSDIRLMFGVKDSLIFLKRIAKYVPKCMEYKLLPELKSIKKYKIKNKNVPSISTVKKIEFLHPLKFVKRYSKKVIYNIEVEDNHNYFANGVLVSNSRYGGEGKNVLISIFDEIAEVRFDRAKERYDNLKNTAFSRFPDHHKIVMISYPRDEFDFMMSHYNEVDEWAEEDKNQVFKSRKSPWEVRSKENAHPYLIEKRLYKLKEDYLPMYRKNPVDSARRYECKFPKIGYGRFIKKFNLVLEKCVHFNRPSPIIWEDIDRDNNIYLTEKELLRVPWQPWFKPGYSYEAYCIEQQLLKTPEREDLHKRLNRELERHSGTQYFIHFDLSQGIYDYAGMVMLHPYQLTPTQIGYYIDLMIQIRPEESEIDFESLRKFVYQLDTKGFEITKCTLDGFQCLTGDTKIKLVNGLQVPIKNLVGKTPYVYSYDNQYHTIKPAKATNIRQTHKKAPVYKIILDNNKSFKATASHPILLRNGKYKTVLNLKPGDSLMPLYTKLSVHKGMKGYELYYEPSKDKYRMTHRQFIKYYKPKEYKIKYRKGYYIHHKNYNKLDNSPDNLIFLTKKNHALVHAVMNQKNHIGKKRSKKSKLRMSQAHKGRTWEDLFGIERANRRRLALSKKNKGKYLKEGYWIVCATCQILFRVYPTRMKQVKRGVIYSPKYCSRECMKQGIKKLWDIGYYKNRPLSGAALKKKLNHKIIRIEYLGNLPVYDMEVPQTNNFALEAGIFVHNSVDFQQQINRRGIESETISMDRTRKPYDTLKGLLYQGRINIYNYLVILRELKELSVTPRTLKVDHPKESQQRLKEEGKKEGSKDISDALAGAAYSAIVAESDVGPSVVDTSEFDHPFEDQLSNLL